MAKRKWLIISRGDRRPSDKLVSVVRQISESSSDRLVTADGQKGYIRPTD